MRKFLFQLKKPFFHSSRSHSQGTVEIFWFNPTAWHCDVMTSQHDAPKLIFPISACRCARKMILFLFLWNFGLLSSKMLSVLYLHNDVTSWRHVMTSKTGCTLSPLVPEWRSTRFWCVDPAIEEGSKSWSHYWLRSVSGFAHQSRDEPLLLSHSTTTARPTITRAGYGWNSCAVIHS